MNEKAPLKGLQVLVVEDTFLVALDLSDQLTESGCAVIGPAASVEQALKQIDGIALDGAVLDVNLRGERSFPIAELLASRGIPFLFLTGYDSATVFPDAFQNTPRLPKPVDTQALTEAVARFRSRAEPDLERDPPPLTSIWGFFHLAAGEQFVPVSFNLEVINKFILSLLKVLP